MTEEAISSDLQTVWKKSSRNADVCDSVNTCCTRLKHFALSATKRIGRCVPNLLLPSCWSYKLSRRVTHNKSNSEKKELIKNAFT